MTIRPNETRLEAVYLHASPSLTITSITLSAPAPNPLPELPASYFHLNPLLSLTTDLDPSKPLIDQHPDYKRRLWTSLAEKEEGELCIDVRNGWVRLPQSREGYGQNVKELAEIVVKIDYEIVMSDASGGEGVVWRRPGDNGLEDVRKFWLFFTMLHAMRRSFEIGYAYSSLLLPYSVSHTSSSTLPLTLPPGIGSPALILPGLVTLGN